ncbi:YdcF family protein [Pseudomonas benzenivorans]|uniref:YdcF family protein n=1 Tax=Pseudomonas benzenivorans TaxID=556533 RepID=A0ABZ0PTP5_9PSED|nr:YdcF family protein [Pseudomonas benzenivorans]WPC04530.1 YdcF family protein [Pseudomonas benzenivorans]
MPIRYMLKHLFMPPGGLLLLLVLGWWLRRRMPRVASCCFVLGVGGLWLMSLPVTVEWSARWLERDPALAEAHWPVLAQRAEAIVVLGGGRERDDPAWGGDQPASMALERLRYAARLARATGLPLLTSGGLHYGQPPSEAALGAEVLARDFAVAVRWQEGASRTTWENATHSARLLRQAGVTRVLLVTQAWHMPRARWCFERQGLEVVAAPLGFFGVANGRPAGGWLPEAKALWQNTLLLNEAVGLIAYPLFYGRADGAE